MDQEDQDPLRTFLKRKLEGLSKKDKTQLTMLCTWLVEIYLNSLNSVKDKGDTKGLAVTLSLTVASCPCQGTRFFKTNSEHSLIPTA